jgi:hypothetical protein
LLRTRGRNGTDPLYIVGVYQGDYDSVGGPAGNWEQCAQAAVDAIRANADTKAVSVAVYTGTFRSGDHSKPWIVDPANNVLYEHHQYFDEPKSGTYPDSFATDKAAIQALGWHDSSMLSHGPRGLTDRRLGIHQLSGLRSFPMSLVHLPTL